MRKLSLEQFAAHANQQIANAEAMRRGHHARSGGYCSCGRQTPCSVGQACQASIAHYEGKLALLALTAVLPVMNVSPHRSPRRWRRMLAALL